MPPAAAIAWGEDGALRARAYDDVYGSRDGALAESQAVFLAGCGLPERWRGRQRFAVAELGFGTGLNALALWALWRRTRDPGAVLHFVSVEGFPLSREDAGRALAPFTEVADLAGRLLARWPVRAFGPQRLWFEEDGFALTLLQGPVEEALGGLSGPIDSWFLDGFAPARNPAMWSAPVLQRVADLSAPGATLATYSVAGPVRRGLQEAGFTVHRAPGFGAKRERLVAGLPGCAVETPRPDSVLVLGGGIAGTCVVHALQRRGLVARLVCAGAGLADGASGNPAGLVMPRLNRDPGPAAGFFRAAFLAAVDFYRTCTPGAFEPCGVMQRPDSARAEVAFADLLADPPWPEPVMTGAEGGGLLHGTGGMLRPKAAIEALVRGVEIRFEARVEALRWQDGVWCLLDADGTVLDQAPVVVIAAGAGIAQFAQTAWLPVALSAGQVDFGPSAVAPPHAVTQGAYCGPLDDGVIFGASFQSTLSPVAATTAEATLANLERLQGLCPATRAGLDPAALRARASVRATTADRLPLMGAAPDAAAWASLQLADGPRHPGLYVLGGLGARGLTTAPLLAETLAAALVGDPSPLSLAMQGVLDPARFLVRAVKRGERIQA
jgi:tRNA 5-methylaminomethyl-2-thiouridine biosynthesis bifunctional protein